MLKHYNKNMILDSLTLPFSPRIGLRVYEGLLEVLVCGKVLRVWRGF